MPTVIWTGVYASVLAFVYVVLAVRVIRLRRGQGVAVGGGDEVLQRAIRAHANFSEYVPLTLLLMFFAELSAPSWVVHAAGILLCLGRGVHAFGISQLREKFNQRAFGMACTFTAMTGCAGTLLVMAISSI